MLPMYTTLSSFTLCFLHFFIFKSSLISTSFRLNHNSSQTCQSLESCLSGQNSYKKVSNLTVKLGNTHAAESCQPQMNHPFSPLKGTIYKMGITSYLIKPENINFSLYTLPFLYYVL